jgi:hypothetical protein
MRARFVTAIPLSMLLACATTFEYVPIDYRLVDHSDKNRIELLYLNDTGKTLCLTTSGWPNAAGKLNQMGDVVFLVVGTKRFPIEDFNTGIPIDDSEHRVLPSEEISAYIPYEDFDLPERLRYEPKSLEFSPRAYVCR